MATKKSSVKEPAPVDVAPNRSIVLPPGTRRIVVADALDLLRSAAGKAVFDIYENAVGDVRMRIRGGAVPFARELRADFLAFVQQGNARPTNPLARWSDQYTGKGSDDDIYEITVDEFTRYAAAYDVRVEVERDADDLPCPLVPAPEEKRAAKSAEAPWAAEAQQLAIAYRNGQWDRLQARPSQMDMAEHVASEWRKLGAGDPRRGLSAATIKRHALTGKLPKDAARRLRQRVDGRGK